MVLCERRRLRRCSTGRIMRHQCAVYIGVMPIVSEHQLDQNSQRIDKSAA